MVVPKAASAKVIGNSKNKFSSDLLKRLWFWIEINKYKSPLPPLFVPASPFPDNLILVPSSTPLGILTETFSSLWILPLPLHFEHALLIVSPWPLHCGQVCWTVKKPWFDLILPPPLQ